MVISMAAVSVVPISAEGTYFAVGSVIFDPEWASDVPEYQMQFDGDAYSVAIPVEEDKWGKSFEYRVNDGTWEENYNDVPFAERSDDNDASNANAVGYVEQYTKEVVITLDPKLLKAGYSCVLAPEPESIERDKASIKLGVGQSYTLHYTVTPSDAYTHFTNSTRKHRA